MRSIQTPRTIRSGAVEILQAHGYPDWVTRAILSHANYSGVPRESRLEHTLFACDEMSGFVTAATLVRPSKSILDLEAASVIKRMKDKAFARDVNRDDLRKGAEEIGLPLAEHIDNVIRFMRERADELGLKGTLECTMQSAECTMEVRIDRAAPAADACRQFAVASIVPSRQRGCRPATAIEPGARSPRMRTVHG